MSSFDGRLHMPGYSRIPLGVEVDISDERMTLTSGQRTIGAWSLKDVDIASMSDGFHIKLDDEEVVLSVFESERFASELGPAVRQASAAMAVSSAAANGAKPSTRPSQVDLTNDDERFDDVRRRIAALSVAVTMDSVAPSEVFRRWLRMLKEINLSHGRGAMPTPLFHRLNTQLLELIPEPTTSQQSGE